MVGLYGATSYNTADNMVAISASTRPVIFTFSIVEGCFCFPAVHQFAIFTVIFGQSIQEVYFQRLDEVAEYLELLQTSASRV
jgi:hypothetical protein